MPSVIRCLTSFGMSIKWCDRGGDDVDVERRESQGRWETNAITYCFWRLITDEPMGFC